MEEETKIFTKTEMQELERRMKGQKKNYKIWYKAKPKVEEIIEKWIPRQKELEKTIKKK